MYFLVGWPKVIKGDQQHHFQEVSCNRDRILFSLLTPDTLEIWFCKPCVPIVYHRRSKASLKKFGVNVTAEWKPDSSMIVIATSDGHLLFYSVEVIEQKGLYLQTDSPHSNLRRVSAELFIKETIPPLRLSLTKEVQNWEGHITGIVCITMTEIMLSTTRGYVLRYLWDGTQKRDYTLDLRRIPFCINQQVSKAIPIVEENVFITGIEYSPLVGGFSIVLNDGRAAFLTASSLKFDPNQVQGIWAQGVEDATCTTINHKYRLITFGRANSECVVYYVDESTGGLEISHTCKLSSKDYPGCPGSIGQVQWTPDGCALMASWTQGGIAMWSTFGALLMCSLGWDYGLNVDVVKNNPLQVVSMEFATEGYQLWLVCKSNEEPSEATEHQRTQIIQLDFVKSAFTINPCMSHQCHLYLQGEDKLYMNSGDTLIQMFSTEKACKDDVFSESSTSCLSTNLVEGRQWLVVPIPSTYSSTNWPIRYSAIDGDGQNMAISGRTGLAHYSISNRRWKLFGNETQEKDFIVTGGLLWWRDYIVMGCYSILDNSDELRFYSKDAKLDNKFAKILKLPAPVLLINILDNQLISFCSNSLVSIWKMKQNDCIGDVEVSQIQLIDISALSVHPACIVSITLTSLKTEYGRGQDNNRESIVLNISGRLLLIQRELKNGERYACQMPTVLASCVENVWVPSVRKPDKVHLTEALWLFCGAHGMRVWLPLYPRNGDKTHNFMSKRIMLPFHLKIYPLAILFEDAIILGAENDTILYSSDTNSPFSLPFNVLQRTSQVYLHQILRQLIRRNLGYHAWEIAQSCMSLSYFPHSLELLLHEVLEEEATSKEPIPDAQMPSIIEFIMEFPVYLQTVVQCARKTEIALWPYLFSAAGKPKELFQECMMKSHLETAASYLIILQNLETSTVSRQYATLLLNTALNLSKWELAKDLVRFLRAIDPNDVESPRTSFILPTKLGLNQNNVNANSDDILLILGKVQGPRVRSYSTTISPKSNINVTGQNMVNESELNRKKSLNSILPTKPEKNGCTAEEFFIDVILQKHARRLLSARRLQDLGYFAAHLDFHLVVWLCKERERAARIDDFINALKTLHEDFSWPYPSCKIQHEEVSMEHLDENLQDFKLNFNNQSRVGDSGYLSFQGLSSDGLLASANTIEKLSQISESSIEESPILPLVNSFTKPEAGSLVQTRSFESLFNESLHLKQTSLKQDLCSQSFASNSSTVWHEDDKNELNTHELNTNNWEMPSTQILEQLSSTGNKGSHRSEVQLRYLLQLFMEANCLEWSLLISVVLRDPMAVVRTINSTKSQEQSIEAVTRLRQGLLLLSYWANTECLSYRTFMLAIQNQATVLTKILETKIQLHQNQENQTVFTNYHVATPILSRSRKTSSSTNNPELNQSDLKSLTDNSMESAGSGQSSQLFPKENNNILYDNYLGDNKESNTVQEDSRCITM